MITRPSLPTTAATTVPNGGLPALHPAVGWAVTRNAVQPGWIEYLLLIVSAICSAIATVQGLDLWPPLNVVAPLCLAAAMAWGCINAVRIHRSSAWQPLIWWRLAMMAYSGVGSLLPLFSSPETRDYVDAFFQTFPGDIAKYNLVSSGFALVCLATVHIVTAVGTRRGVFASNLGVGRSALTAVEFGVIAILVALPIRVFNTIIPLIQGEASSPPASFAMLELLSSVGYALLVAHYLETRSRALWIVVALVIIDSTLGLLTFAKLAALFPFVMGALGAIYQRPTALRAGTLAAIVATLYVVTSPMVSYGRAVDWGSGIPRPPQFDRSVEILRGFTFEKAEEPGTEEIQFSWARLAYYNAGSLAINQYDRGVPGHSIDNIDVVLIPRLLYEDKPIITDISREFNYLATGNYYSSSNPGIPAEGYWIGGWGGVLLFGIIYGAVFAIWSIYAMMVVDRRAWHLMFVVLIGIRVGTRIDGLFVVDFFPIAVAALLAHYGLRFGNRLIVRRSSRSPGSSGSALA